MRLLDTKSGRFVERDPAAWKGVVYAILSHTWDTEKAEQTYEELRSIQRRYDPASQAPPGGPQHDTSSSSEHGQDAPVPTPSPPSERPSDSPSMTTPLMVPSTPSKSWLARGVARLKRWFHCPSARNAPQVPQSQPPPQSIWDDPELSPKIRDACAVARKNGYRYIWIDSCCIDKSSSSELSEAINSMYKWYGLAAVCYAYLADVPPGDDHHAEGSRFRESRWFGRGWTLQELVAPGWVEFLSMDWAPIGSKHTLVDLVKSVTRIDYKALLRLEPLDAFSVAQRLSWAANRETTREEDRAYSLLGIFDINMSTLYGEGDRAFRRLQEHIMQRIPGWQSLFAWGDVYLSSQLSEPDKAGNIDFLWQTLCAKTYDRARRRLEFATSPDSFKGCQAIRSPRHETVHLPSSAHLNKIEYTSTPYGIRTQFQMIPLSRDLLLHAGIPHSKDVQLNLSNSPKGSRRWYLAILGCEHAEHPGHLLGRVCYIRPSNSGVEFMHTGYIDFDPNRGGVPMPDLFPLSPETIEHHRPQTELTTVYIPHPHRADLPLSPRNQPYTTIKLVLLRETRNTLRSRGYSADLRDPDPDHPTTHWLTLSKDEHTITVEFRHTLEDSGGEFTIDAEVKMFESGSHVERDSAPDSDQVGRHTTWIDTWWNLGGWETVLAPQQFRLSAAGARPLTVDLGLDFAGHGYYYLRVDVLSDTSSALAAVELAVDQAGEAESPIEDRPPPSRAINTEDADHGQEEDTGVQWQEVANVEAQVGDVAAASDSTADEDGHGVPA